MLGILRSEIGDISDPDTVQGEPPGCGKISTPEPMASSSRNAESNSALAWGGDDVSSTGSANASLSLGVSAEVLSAVTIAGGVSQTQLARAAIQGEVKQRDSLDPRPTKDSVSGDNDCHQPRPTATTQSTSAESTGTLSRAEQAGQAEQQGRPQPAEQGRSQSMRVVADETEALSGVSQQVDSASSKVSPTPSSAGTSLEAVSTPSALGSASSIHGSSSGGDGSSNGHETEKRILERAWDLYLKVTR